VNSTSESWFCVDGCWRVLTALLLALSVNMASKHAHFTGFNTLILSEFFFLERRKTNHIDTIAFQSWMTDFGVFATGKFDCIRAVMIKKSSTSIKILFILFYDSFLKTPSTRREMMSLIKKNNPIASI
jgi:hypothetical protein